MGLNINKCIIFIATLATALISLALELFEMVSGSVHGLAMYKYSYRGACHFRPRSDPAFQL